MKNKTLLILLVIFFPLGIFAQELSGFGAVSAEELTLKECAFDKDAAAVVLLNQATADHDDEYHLITQHHVRIKILNEKGFDAANISLQFYRKDGFEIIDMLEAIVINTNASGEIITESVSKKSIYTKNINERIGLVTFAFPNVKVGSIIEYKYRSLMKHYGGLNDWYFQKELPVVKSKFILTVVPNREFTYIVNKRDDMGVIVKPDKSSGKIYFEMNNIPALTSEPYMDAREDYVQKIIFQLSGYDIGFGKTNYMTSWDEVIKELLLEKGFGSQIGKNIPGTSAFIDEVKKITADEDKMKIIYKYVHNNMSWNSTYSKYAWDGVKEPWEKKKGTSGEINLILINLLKDAGLEVYPALVSQRDHGKVNTTLPFVDQFNTVFACVVINGKKYYLDATDNYTPVHMIPSDILNTTALIINRKKGGLVEIANDSLQYMEYINAQMELTDNGSFSGEVFIKSSGYSRMQKISDYKQEGQDKYINSNYQKNGITIKEFEFLNQSNDSLPAEQKFKFNTTLSASGDYLFVPLNIFSGFERNPFTSDNRFSNVNFGYKRTISTYTVIALPKNFTLDPLPKPVTMTTPDKDIVFSRTVTFDKEANSVTCMFVFDFKKSLYTVEEYGILQQVYKKMFEFLKEPVVLKKK